MGFDTSAISLNSNETSHLRVAGGTVNWYMTLAFWMEMN